MTTPAEALDLYPDGVEVVLTPYERAQLRHNKPGKSGQMGGMQGFENWAEASYERGTGRLFLPPDKLDRCLNYCANYGPGGPNKRIRAAFIGALERIGIVVHGAAA